MRIAQASIRNFRLLSNADLMLEHDITLVVGRNNSGKTSLSEVLRRFLGASTAKFQLEDFSSACYEKFCEACLASQNGQDEEAIRALVPFIELRLQFKYDPNKPDLGPLKPFVIDLEETCDTAIAVLRYECNDGQLSKLFEGAPTAPLDDAKKLDFFKGLRERVPANFGLKIWAEDPNDAANTSSLPTAALHNLVVTGFVNAQRGLDDVTVRETDILAKVLETLFTNASSATADASDKAIADALKNAVQEIQKQIDGSFGTQLQQLLPTLQSFGYPGLNGQELHTEALVTGLWSTRSAFDQFATHISRCITTTSFP